MNKELNGLSPISLAYSMINLRSHSKLCKAKKKILPYFSLKVYKVESLLIKTVCYTYQCLSISPLTIDNHDEAF